MNLQVQLQSSEIGSSRKLNLPIGSGKVNAPVYLAAFEQKQESTNMSSAFEGCKGYSPIRSNGGKSSFITTQMIPFIQKQDSQSQISELTMARQQSLFTEVRSKDAHDLVKKINQLSILKENS